jgi:HEAT repeat protein
MTPQSETFLREIQDANADTRYAAWVRAGEMDGEVIPELGKLLAAASPGVRRAAEEALKNIVHAVGKDPAAARRPAAIRQFIALTADGQPAWTRTVALRHLSLIGGDETVPVAARILRDAALQEEAVFCLERIPGRASTDALMAAFPPASDRFKPRILAALGHRSDQAAADLCAEAMASPNQDIAIAGMKALARIGKKPAKDVKPPDFNSLPAWQQVEYTDSALRFAEGQLRRGNIKEAIGFYEHALKRPEEHVQCAAIIGLAKTGTPEAAALIFPMLRSRNNSVRITASKAWAEMGKNS